MDLRALLRMLGRRWYIVVVGLLATAALGTAVFRFVPPTYEAVGRTLLLPPAGSVEAGGNPFLGLQPLGPSVDVLVRYLDADRSRLEIAQTSPTAEYTVSADAATNGPIIVVVAEDLTPEAATSAMQKVLDLIPVALDDLQSSINVPPDASIRSMVLAVDIEPEMIVRQTLRAVIATVGAGLMFTFMLTAAVDGLVKGRSRKIRRRRARTVAVDQDGAEASGSADLEDTPVETTTIELEPPMRGSALHR